MRSVEGLQDNNDNASQQQQHGQSLKQHQQQQQQQQRRQRQWQQLQWRGEDLSLPNGDRFDLWQTPLQQLVAPLMTHSQQHSCLACVYVCPLVVARLDHSSWFSLPEGRHLAAHTACA
jgi:hypothetical protein